MWRERRRDVRTRTAARVGWSVFGLSALLSVVAVGLNISRPQYSMLAFTTGDIMVVAAVLVFGWFGALIVSRRPTDPIGWILCVFGLSAGLNAFANEYAVYGLIRHPGAVPAAAALAWFTLWAYAIVLGLLAALLVLFPNGRPPSPRWRWVLWLAGIANSVIVATELSGWSQRGVGMLLLTRSVESEPAGAAATWHTAGFIGALVAVLAGVASLVARFTGAHPAERAQIKLFLAAVIAVVAGFPLMMAALILMGVESELIGDVWLGLLISLIPVATGIAILKHRLYDIDRIISRTVSYALLSAVLVSVYAAGVLVLSRGLAPVGGGSDLAVAVGTLAAAAVFQPARRRIQDAVDRRFNRRRYDAVRTIDDFSARLRDEVDLDKLRADLVDVVARTMEPAGASLWLRAPLISGVSSNGETRPRVGRPARSDMANGRH
jgi:hypothetical protein